MKRWKVEASFGKSCRTRVTFVDAETRDEAQHIARERFVKVDVGYAGALYVVEPVEGKGWI